MTYIFIMTDVELYRFLRMNYNISFPHAYVHWANVFNELDRNKKDLQVHHVCPRSCGGDNKSDNLVKVTFHHHRKLHQLILQCKDLTDEQRNKLTFAYHKMRKG